MERPVEGTEVNRCHAKNRSVSEKSQEWRNRIRIEGKYSRYGDRSEWNKK